MVSKPLKNTYKTGKILWNRKKDKNLHKIFGPIVRRSSALPGGRHRYFKVGLHRKEKQQGAIHKVRHHFFLEGSKIEEKVMADKGPFINYVSMFLVLKISKNWPFLTDKIWINLPLSKYQIKWKIVLKFYGLFRVSELYHELIHFENQSDRKFKKDA